MQPPALPASRTHWDALRWPLAWGLSLATTLLALAALAAAYQPLRISLPRQLHAELGHTATQAPNQVEPSAPPQPTHPQTRHVATAPSLPAAILPGPAPAQITPTQTPPTPEINAAPSASKAEPPTRPPIQGTGDATAPTNSSAMLAAKGPGTGVPPHDGQAALSIRCPTQIKPAFPKLALEDSINHGEVRARLHLDAEGRVTGIDILEASPTGYFENAVRKSALQWHCQGSGQADSIVVSFSFQAR